MRVSLLLVLFIFLTCGIVQAAENSMAVTIPVFTKHFPSSSPDLNEHNHGFGLEYILRKDVAVTAGLFNNSLRKHTFYVGGIYTPFRVVGLHTGVVIGLDLSGGYNSVNPVKPIIGALHFTTGNESPVGFNIDVLPGGGNKNGNVVYGAAAISMKYSF
ncbi:hypothetical protein SOV_11660 [Sporomusa ovata DSM 2662]|uniref:Uncharacterized protein n=1 Tax=Sporomusa ovata TaxID=2378 RepID=A0A0U1KWX7_9FIRM|nr:hypothetical protein [Sporomusa ovata]EQB28789.1 hypothetical protein SOV_1c05040 [Sporomusa ovata DSM 2662]CQR71948.1 hypothetical protein SpAn4DRAFT_5010 [Sporomusa ovata]